MHSAPHASCANALAVVLAAALCGCTTVADLAGVERAGIQADGSYRLTAQEVGASCRDLAERIETLLAEMQPLKSRIPGEQAAMPATMAAVLDKISGHPDGGSASARRLRNAETRARALDASARAKGCTPVDLEARLAGQPA